MDERTKLNVASLIILTFGFFLVTLFNGCTGRLLSAPAPIPRNRPDGPIPYWRYQHNLDNEVYWRDGKKLRKSLLRWNKYIGAWVLIWDDATAKDWQGVPSERWAPASKRRIYRTKAACQKWEFGRRKSVPLLHNSRATFFGYPESRTN